MTDILDTLRALYDRQGDAIEQWFTAQRRVAAPFFYTSVDLRHSGPRIAPVDTNLYPAGFNNLSLAARARASRYASHYLHEHFPSAKNILIAPENHTRNLGYLENLAVLSDILAQAGYEVRIGSLASPEPLELTTLSGRAITELPLKNENGKLITQEGFLADIIILNNDLSSGMHPLLESIAQPVMPSPYMGWYMRRKSIHFHHYHKLAKDFAATFGLDAWHFSARSHHCGLVDFKDPKRLEYVAASIDQLLDEARRKYADHGVNEEPYAFIKADSGTYGMGIMTVKNGAEILELNKKERNKMQVVKEGTQVSDIIIQEGIPTIDLVDGKPAEPMVYMIDGLPVGGMYRVNGSRVSTNNLNAAGMEFVGMCDEMEVPDVNRRSVRECDFRAYGIIAAIAALAAAREDYGIAANI